MPPLVAVSVQSPIGRAALDPDRRKRLEAHQRMAEDLGAEIVMLEGNDVAAELTSTRASTTSTSSSSAIRPKGCWPTSAGSVVRKILKASTDIDVHVIGERGRELSDAGDASARS